MTNMLKLPGVIKRTDGPLAEVHVICSDACSACDAKIGCHAVSASAEQLIRVQNRTCQPFQPGDRVYVCMASDRGMQALGYAFVLPFGLLLTVLGVMFWMTADELLSAVVAEAILLPYYWMLYLMRQRLSRTFALTLESRPA